MTISPKQPRSTLPFASPMGVIDYLAALADEPRIGTPRDDLRAGFRNFAARRAGLTPSYPPLCKGARFLLLNVGCFAIAPHQRNNRACGPNFILAVDKTSRPTRVACLSSRIAMNASCPYTIDSAFVRRQERTASRPVSRLRGSATTQTPDSIRFGLNRIESSFSFVDRDVRAGRRVRLPRHHSRRASVRICRSPR